MKLKIKWKAIDPVALEVQGEYIVSGENQSEIFKAIVDRILELYPGIKQNLNTINIIDFEILEL